MRSSSGKQSIWCEGESETIQYTAELADKYQTLTYITQLKHLLSMIHIPKCQCQSKVKANVQ